MFAYVGSRTTRERNARGDGITVWQVNDTTGDLTLVQTVGDLVNPSFLLRHPTLPVLYTVHGDQQQVSAFRINEATGHLSPLNQQDCGGRNPVHLALSPDARHLVISNHLGSSLAVLPVAVDGALEPLSQLVTLDGAPGPHRVEQPFAKPHFNPFDPSGQWVLVPDKGVDRVFVFRFAEGRLTPAAQPFVQAREGAGPRHLAFHPTQPWVYVINELDSTVTAYRFDEVTGALQPFQVLSALADSFTGNSRASKKLSPRLRWTAMVARSMHRTVAKTASPCSTLMRRPGGWRCARPHPAPAKRRASSPRTRVVYGSMC